MLCETVPVLCLSPIIGNEYSLGGVGRQQILEGSAKAVRVKSMNP